MHNPACPYTCLSLIVIQYYGNKAKPHTIADKVNATLYDCVYLIRLYDFFTEQKYSREVCIIPVDFSDGMEIYPNLAEQLKDLDIGTLGEDNGVIVFTALFADHLIVT